MYRHNWRKVSRGKNFRKISLVSSNKIHPKQIHMDESCSKIMTTDTQPKMAMEECQIGKY